MTPQAPAQPKKLLYTSLPFAYSQPPALAALAALHGLRPPPAETARVLELGCASGGNIIPIAARFPDASLTGIDITEGAIAVGRRRAAALGLANIQLDVADIVDFAERKQEFDYIICHGILSWVPEPVRQAIFRICRTQLAQDGLAVISFNVLPGWRLEQIIRDICIRNVDMDADPMTRAEQALAALNGVAMAAAETSPYGFLVRQAAQRLATLDRSYLLAEFLAPVHECFFFEDVLGQAQANGLHYVSDGEIATASPEVVFPSGAAAIRALAKGNVTNEQRFLDMVSGRPFRRAIFAKQKAFDSLQVAEFPALHASLALDRDPATPMLFRTSDGHQFKASDENIADALGEITRAYPGTCQIADATRNVKDKGALDDVLTRLARSGYLRLQSVPLSVGRAEDAKPMAFSLARLEARENQDWVTTLHHQSITVSQDAMSLLPHLDGSNDRTALAAVLGDQAEGARTDQALSELERQALLTPDKP